MIKDEKSLLVKLENIAWHSELSCCSLEKLFVYSLRLKIIPPFKSLLFIFSIIFDFIHKEIFHHYIQSESCWNWQPIKLTIQRFTFCHEIISSLIKHISFVSTLVDKQHFMDKKTREWNLFLRRERATDSADSCFQTEKGKLRKLHAFDETRATSCFEKREKIQKGEKRRRKPKAFRGFQWKFTLQKLSPPRKRNSALVRTLPT